MDEFREWFPGQAWPFICLKICVTRCSSPHGSLKLESNISSPWCWLEKMKSSGKALESWIAGGAGCTCGVCCLTPHWECGSLHGSCWNTWQVSLCFSRFPCFPALAKYPDCVWYLSASFLRWDLSSRAARALHSVQAVWFCSCRRGRGGGVLGKRALAAAPMEMKDAEG